MTQPPGEERTRGLLEAERLLVGLSERAPSPTVENLLAQIRARF